MTCDVGKTRGSVFLLRHQAQMLIGPTLLGPARMPFAPARMLRGLVRMVRASARMAGGPPLTVRGLAKGVLVRCSR